jgi:hypothetical protein
VNGVLPVWTQWWSEEEVSGLFPDAATRGRVEGQQHQLPLTYFAEPLTVPQGGTPSPARTGPSETRTRRRHGPPARFAKRCLERHVAREIFKLLPYEKVLLMT